MPFNFLPYPPMSYLYLLISKLKGVISNPEAVGVSCKPLRPSQVKVRRLCSRLKLPPKLHNFLLPSSLS